MVHREFSNLSKEKTPMNLQSVLSCVAIALMLVCASSARAQEKNPKYEVGLHYSALNIAEKSDTDGGFGVRFTYNFNDYLGAEAETTYFGNLREGSEGNERQGLFGVRAGKRTGRYGIFAKARPGVTRFYSLSRDGLGFFDRDRDRFTMDVGGVFEYYPHRNVAVRVDAGDTMIHFKTGDFFFDRLDQPMFVQRRLSHNLQINVGVALRF
jgi:opacity protein-like surface antigen